MNKKPQSIASSVRNAIAEFYHSTPRWYRIVFIVVIFVIVASEVISDHNYFLVGHTSTADQENLQQVGTNDESVSGTGSLSAQTIVTPDYFAKVEGTMLIVGKKSSNPVVRGDASSLIKSGSEFVVSDRSSDFENYSYSYVIPCDTLGKELTSVILIVGGKQTALNTELGDSQYTKVKSYFPSLENLEPRYELTACGSIRYSSGDPVMGDLKVTMVRPFRDGRLIGTLVNLDEMDGAIINNNLDIGYWVADTLWYVGPSGKQQKLLDLTSTKKRVQFFDGINNDSIFVETVSQNEAGEKSYSVKGIEADVFDFASHGLKKFSFKTGSYPGLVDSVEILPSNTDTYIQVTQPGYEDTGYSVYRLSDMKQVMSYESDDSDSDFAVYGVVNDQALMAFYGYNTTGNSRLVDPGDENVDIKIDLLPLSSTRFVPSKRAVSLISSKILKNTESSNPYLKILQVDPSGQNILAQLIYRQCTESPCNLDDPSYVHQKFKVKALEGQPLVAQEVQE